MVGLHLSTKGWQGHVNYFFGLGQFKTTNDGTFYDSCQESLKLCQAKTDLKNENQILFATCVFECRKNIIFKSLYKPSAVVMPQKKALKHVT